MSSFKSLESFDSLIQKYPRNIVIKADLGVQGVRYTDAAKEIGKWAMPASMAIYDFSQEEIEGRTKDATEGWAVEPEVLKFEDGTHRIISYNTTSPYELRKEENEGYYLYRDGQQLEPVSFIQRPGWYSKRTSHGTLMANVGRMLGDLFEIAVSNFCEYWRTNEECGFCNMNATVNTRLDLGLKGTQIRKRLDDMGETFDAALKERPDCDLNHYDLVGGALFDLGNEADLYLKFIDVTQRVAVENGFDGANRIISQAFPKSDGEKLYSAGCKEVEWNLEVWDEKLFPIVCPGKDKHIGRDKWIDYLYDAVDVFGKGNVICNFVLGTELVQPHGFKTLKEAEESCLAGAEELLQHGVFPRFIPLIPGRGSAYEGMKVAPIEYFLKVEYEAYKLKKKYNNYSCGTVCPKCDQAALGADFASLMPQLPQVA